MIVDVQLTRNFWLREFVCKCGCGKKNIDQNFVTYLQIVREILDEEIDIMSGVRCEKHNRDEGGKASSSHTLGYAADITCTTSWYRFKLLKAIIESGKFTRIGINKNSIHVDIDPTKDPEVMWHYYK